MKKVLCGGMALLVFIIGVVVIIGADFVSKESERRYLSECKGTLRYLVEEKYNIKSNALFYDEVELDEDTVEKFYDMSKRLDDKLKLYNYTTLYDSNFKYSVNICDIEIDVTGETGYEFYYDNKLIEYEKLYFEFVELVEDTIRDLDKVYLFDVSSYANSYYSYFEEFDNIQISEIDKKDLLEYYEDTDFNPEPVDLAFMGKYVVVIGKDTITFDNLNGYALVNGRIAFLSRDFRLILNKYFKLTVSDFPILKDDLPSNAKVGIRLVNHNDVYSVSESDRRQIIEYWNGTDKNKIINKTVSMDAVSYLFVLGNNDVTFGYIEGKDYVYYNGQGLYVERKVRDYLAKVVDSLVNPGDPECCSCCPDLKPGEYCIDACCPCAD